MEATIFANGTLPVVLYCGQISDLPDWSFPCHKHEYCEIIYIIDGEGEFIIDGMHYTAKKGDILIYNKGVIHDEKSNPKNPLKTFFCSIKNINLYGLDEDWIIPKGARPVLNTGKHSNMFESCMTSMFEESRSLGMGYETLFQGLATFLIVLILRISNENVQTQLSPDNAVTSQIKKYIDENYTRDLSLEKIANTLYISKDYISHIFRHETGYSPIKYIINLRMGKAKELLLTSDNPVWEIAERVGYDNPNYFTMLFKKVIGISPAECRRKEKSEKEKSQFILNSTVY